MPKITGHYSNGAVQVNHPYRYDGRYHDSHFVAFSDCETCRGQGRVTNRCSLIGYACPVCEKRHDPRDSIKERVAQLFKEVRKELRRQPATPEQFIDHPLAQEYRALLRAYWAYLPPIFTPKESP